MLDALAVTFSFVPTLATQSAKAKMYRLKKQIICI